MSDGEEIARLRNAIRIHAGDVMSLSNELDEWRGRALTAEEALATAQATYLQFCKKHDEEMESIRSETIELCAKIAENNGWEATAAQIRDLKEIT